MCLRREVSLVGGSERDEPTKPRMLWVVPKARMNLVDVKEDQDSHLACVLSTCFSYPGKECPLILNQDQGFANNCGGGQDIWGSFKQCL